MKIFPILTIIVIIFIVILLPRHQSQPELIYTPTSIQTSKPDVLDLTTKEASTSGEVYDSFLVPKDLQ